MCLPNARIDFTYSQLLRSAKFLDTIELTVGADWVGEGWLCIRLGSKCFLSKYKVARFSQKLLEKIDPSNNVLEDPFLNPDHGYGTDVKLSFLVWAGLTRVSPLTDVLFANSPLKIVFLGHVRLLFNDLKIKTLTGRRRDR